MFVTPNVIERENDRIRLTAIYTRMLAHVREPLLEHLLSTLGVPLPSLGFVRLLVALVVLL